MHLLCHARKSGHGVWILRKQKDHLHCFWKFRDIFEFHIIVRYNGTQITYRVYSLSLIDFDP
jgi:hypothetical protein